MINKWLTTLELGKVACMLSIDFTGDFDSVDCMILLEILTVELNNNA